MVPNQSTSTAACGDATIGMRVSGTSPTTTAALAHFRISRFVVDPPSPQRRLDRMPQSGASCPAGATAADAPGGPNVPPKTPPAV